MSEITPCVHSVQMQLDAAKERIAELEEDMAYYRCCALSGEVPDELCKPSSVALQVKSLQEQGE
jgi:hypothetical protein